jgi:NAD(P)-dependent dehydrogenase (short-subunit alcohol dehydrogenase family)
MTHILITGANRGIGLGFATHYLAQGAQVFATCRAASDRAALDALQTRYPDSLTIVELDVTDEDSIARARQQVGQHIPALDILINNAGVFSPARTFRKSVPTL